MWYTETAVTIIDDSSNFVMSGLQRLSKDFDPTPLWELDRREMLASIRSEQPSEWVHLITAHYLTEASLQLKAMGTLMRAEEVDFSLPLLVRAIVERMGVVGWILNAPGSWELRMRRSGLAWSVSNHKYSNLYRNSDPDGYKWLKNQQDEIRKLLVKRFPPSIDTLLATIYAGDPDDWEIEGDKYPTFRNLAVMAFENPEVDPGMAKFAYDYLAVHSHPTIHAGLEKVKPQPASEKSSETFCLFFCVQSGPHCSRCDSAHFVRPSRKAANLCC